jgi:hypothetical protein
MPADKAAILLHHILTIRHRDMLISSLKTSPFIGRMWRKGQKKPIVLAKEVATTIEKVKAERVAQINTQIHHHPVH